MKRASRIGDAHTCPANGAVPAGPGPVGEIPHVGGPVSMPGAPTVHAEGAFASRLGDYATCSGTGSLDVVVEGAATVLFEQLPAVRMTDGTIHGGKVVLGTARVLIGGPTFTLPSNITIVGSPDFQNKVIRDLYLLSTTRTGREILRRLGDSGQPVIIMEQEEGVGSDAHQLGIPPCGGVIRHTTDAPGIKYGMNGQVIPGPQQVSLGHELIHVLHYAEDSYLRGHDPNAPASEPNIEDEEAQTIGVGSHEHEFPTENTLRDDLGLPRRGNHLGRRANAGEALDPTSLRPGRY